MGAALVIIGAFVGLTLMFLVGNYLYCYQLVKVGYRPFPLVPHGRPSLDRTEPATDWLVSVLNGVPIFPLPVTSIQITRDVIEEDDPRAAFRIERAEVDHVELVHWTPQGWFAVFRSPTGRYRSLAITTGDMEGLAADLDAMGWPIVRPRVRSS